MTDNIKFWLTEMYNNEIEEARCAASNEHLWALGSDGESALQHEMNAEEQRDYVRVLEELRDSLK